MIDAPAPAARPRGLRALAIVFTIVCAMLLIPAALMAITSPMLTDSGVSAGVWALILGALFGPLVLLLSPIVAWTGYGTRHYRLARFAMCVPVIWLAYMVAAFGLLSLTPPHPM